MKITYDNYEVYALEYLEGTLSPEIERAFEDFLHANPDIKEEVTGLAGVYLTPDQDLRYPSKDQLYHIPPKGFILPLSPRVWAAAAIILLLVAAGGIIWLNQITPGSGTSHLADNHPKAQDRGDVFIVPDSMINPNSNESLTGQNEENSDTPEPVISRVPLSPEKNHRPFEKEDIVKVLPRKTSIPETAPARVIDDNSHEEILAHVWNEHLQHKNADADPVTFLPTTVFLVETSDAIRGPELKNTLTSPAHTATTYRIHIPGEFLSETWTDLSLNHFKKKLIPEFFKSE